MANEELLNAAQQINDRIKAKEAILKDLDEAVKVAQKEMEKRLAVIRDAYAKEKLELELAIAPLKYLKNDCEAVRRELVKLSQAKLDAIAEIEAAKGVVIRKANDVLREKQEQLAKMETSIAQCKAKVASL